MPVRSTPVGCRPGAKRDNSIPLSGIQFVSSSDGWAIAPSGDVLATVDGGQHWIVQVHVPRASSLDFVDRLHGWVVAPQKVWATTDGGAHWRALPEPCALIRSVHFASPAIGYAIAGGLLLRTTDGGEHWWHVAGPANAQSVCATDLRHAWLTADGHIYRTTDAAQTWRLSAWLVRTRRSDLPRVNVECAGSRGAWAEWQGPGAAMQEAHIGFHWGGHRWTPIFTEHFFPTPGVHVKAESPGSWAATFSAIDSDDAAFVDFCAACGVGTSPIAFAERGGSSLVRRGNVGDITSALAASFVSLDEGWVTGLHTVVHIVHGHLRTTTDVRIVHTGDGGRSWSVQYSVRE